MRDLAWILLLVIEAFVIVILAYFVIVFVTTLGAIPPNLP